MGGWIGVPAAGLLLMGVQPACGQVLKLEIITEIRPPHVQAGEKSRQAISIDLANSRASSTVSTGVTQVVPGWDWGSVRDKFELKNVTFGSPRITFIAKGQTASPVLFMPDIDYQFSVILNRVQKKIWISGCHNRFPSYRILINGASLYDQNQVGNAFTGLIGVCDTISIVEGSY
ncbi:hypothetical protein [Bosea sp. FBZP-16]|uniref:hypothetical protein n=1 Tax=Bosea sp. FBZP-16 TaxID=2065382 RepID=UPI00131A2148|nr:hypothetical protein [Bosea sp. FBZP-16]